VGDCKEAIFPKSTTRAPSIIFGLFKRWSSGVVRNVLGQAPVAAPQSLGTVPSLSSRLP